MANVIHRTTAEYRTSVNTPDFDPTVWLVGPDMSAVSGLPQKYIKVVGNDVLSKTQAEKDQVDADNQTAQDVSNSVSEHADNAAALAAGLKIGTQYRAADFVKVVH